MDTVGRVRELSDGRKLTLFALAQRCGVAYSTLSNTRRRGGQLTVDTIEQICVGIGITMAEFFSRKGA